MDKGNGNPPQDRVERFQKLHRKVIQRETSPLVVFPQPEEKPAAFLLDIDMQFVTDKRVHFIVQIGDAFPDTVSGRVYAFLLQQQGIPEIRITQEFVVIPRDYVYTVAFAAVVTIHGKIILCQRYEGCA